MEGEKVKGDVIEHGLNPRVRILHSTHNKSAEVNINYVNEYSIQLHQLSYENYELMTHSHSCFPLYMQHVQQKTDESKQNFMKT